MIVREVGRLKQDGLSRNSLQPHTTINCNLTIAFPRGEPVVVPHLYWPARTIHQFLLTVRVPIVINWHVGQNYRVCMTAVDVPAFLEGEHRLRVPNEAVISCR